MENFKRWVMNAATSFLGCVVLPLTTITKLVCNAVDIFIDSQKLTDVIEKINNFEKWLSQFDGK